MLTVRDIYAYIDSRAPFASQEDFDNAGLLTGSFSQEVTAIHVALDCTEAVIEEAEALKANLIVTHHPLMFHPRKQMTEEDSEGRILCRLIRGRIALLAAHTNLDRAPGGINDVLASLCGLQETEDADFLRVGTLSAPVPVGELRIQLQKKLRDVIRLMGSENAIVHRLAVSSGSGGAFWQDAKALGADVFLSGEIRHHEALACSACGLIALEAGHYATEAPGVFALAETLQTYLDKLKYKVRVSKSLLPAYRA